MSYPALIAKLREYADCMCGYPLIDMSTEDFNHDSRLVEKMDEILRNLKTDLHAELLRRQVYERET